MHRSKRRARLQRLFDHLIGEQLDRVGHLDVERPGRLQVDDELEFGGLQDRQVSGLRAFEDLTGVDADLTIHVENIGPIAHQPTGFDMPSASTWQAVWADFATVREGRSGEARSRRARWYQDQSQCVEAQGDELRAYGTAR